MRPPNSVMILRKPWTNSMSCVFVSPVMLGILIQTYSGRDGKVRLWRALFVAYGSPYLLAACLKIAQDCLAFLQPQLLRWLLSYISAYQSAQDGASFGGSPGPSPLQGFAIAVLMFVAAATQTFILHQVCLLELKQRRCLTKMYSISNCATKLVCVCALA
jgi:hypothetical protein